jgi:alkylation response protein AidB-like acyl-CoA dehydrogenase
MTTYAKDASTGRVSAFIVDGNARGLRTEEMKNKIGLLTVKNAEVYFDKCVVPKKNLLGTKGQGLNIAYSALIDGRLSVAAGAVGVMEDCLAEAVAYAKSRRQHGGVLAKKQLIQEHIARIAIGIESSRWLTYRAAAARQRLYEYVEGLKENGKWLEKLGRQNREYSALRSNADRLAAIAKFHASNCSFECANRAVQVFGSAPLSRYAGHHDIRGRKRSAGAKDSSKGARRRILGLLERRHYLDALVHLLLCYHERRYGAHGLLSGRKQ